MCGKDTLGHVKKDFAGGACIIGKRAAGDQPALMCDEHKFRNKLTYLYLWTQASVLYSYCTVLLQRQRGAGGGYFWGGERWLETLAPAKCSLFSFLQPEPPFPPLPHSWSLSLYPHTHNHTHIPSLSFSRLFFPAHRSLDPTNTFPFVETRREKKKEGREERLAEVEGGRGGAI